MDVDVRPTNGGNFDLHEGIEDDVGEEQNALNEDQANTKGECATLGLSAPEEFMVQDTSFGTLPFVDEEANQDHQTNDQRGQNPGVGPGI